ncbi:hypothetical protein PAXY110619_26410 [Paenibacillus xylanexedens]|uniref:Uncharacterized protein n=1 Tax=Paenibacillus xylanexedens TaxID=528191 RepID=A0ABS4S244_PAEXY|nr:hypothetical protein [Paenibacillus xylanexedens]
MANKFFSLILKRLHIQATKEARSYIETFFIVLFVYFLSGVKKVVALDVRFLW